MTIMFSVRTYSLGPIQTNCYIVSNKNKECLIFDPGEEGARLVKELRGKGLKPLAILLTHTHFDHIGQVARRESAKLLVSKVEEMVQEDVPVVITGDFNTNVEDLAMAPIVLSFKDARKVSPVTDREGTFNNWGRNEKVTIIDHIFFKNLTPLKFRTVKENYGAPYISDHYPVVFEGQFE